MEGPPCNFQQICSQIAQNTAFCQTRGIQKRSVLFWVITWWVVVISSRRFGINYRSHLQGSRIHKVESIPKEAAKNVNLLYLWGLMPQGLRGPYPCHWMVQRKEYFWQTFLAVHFPQFSLSCTEQSSTNQKMLNNAFVFSQYLIFEGTEHRQSFIKIKTFVYK